MVTSLLALCLRDHNQVGSVIFCFFPSFLYRNIQGEREGKSCKKKKGHKDSEWDHEMEKEKQGVRITSSISPTHTPPQPPPPPPPQNTLNIPLISLPVTVILFTFRLHICTVLSGYPRSGHYLKTLFKITYKQRIRESESNYD